MMNPDGKKRTLIKLSGDLQGNQKVFQLIREEQSQGHDVTVLVGGGSEITAALQGIDSRYEPLFTTPFLGRRLNTPAQERVRFQELRQNRAEMRSRLLKNRIRGVTVVTPYIPIDGIANPVNADIFAILAVHTYNKVIICTLPERKEKKESDLKPLYLGFEDKIVIVAV